MTKKIPVINCPDMPCDNEFCINHKVNSEIEDWNKTQCSLYEVDPYEPITNEEGVRIDTCKARQRFMKMWA